MSSLFPPPPGRLEGDRPVLGLEPLRPDRPWSAAPAPRLLPLRTPALQEPQHPALGRRPGSSALAPVCVPALLPAGGQSSPAGVTGPQVTAGGTEAGEAGSEFD